VSGRDEETAPVSRTKKQAQMGSTGSSSKANTFQPTLNSEEAIDAGIFGDSI
jgi:hypothetical protein